MKSPRTVLLLVALSALGFWCALAPKPPAPIVALSLIDGRQLDTATLRGKVVFVNFWATSCPPCVKEMPQMAATQSRFAARGYETVAVAMSHDKPEWVREFARRHVLPFPVALDASGVAADAFGKVRLTPTSFLIDRRGRIVQQYVGEPDWTKLNARIEALLVEG